MSAVVRMSKTGRQGRRPLQSRSALDESAVVAGRAGDAVVLSVASSGSGGAKVGSQGRKPLERQGPSSQAPEGRQSSRCLPQSVAPPGLCCLGVPLTRGLRPWLPTVVPPGLVGGLRPRLPAVVPPELAWGLRHWVATVVPAELVRGLRPWLPTVVPPGLVHGHTRQGLSQGASNVGGFVGSCASGPNITRCGQSS